MKKTQKNTHNEERMKHSMIVNQGYVTKLLTQAAREFGINFKALMVFLWFRSAVMDMVCHTLLEDSMASSHPDISLGNSISSSLPSANAKSVG